MADTVRAVDYQPRVVDEEVDALIADGVAAISIEGARAVGKTASAAERATDVFLLEHTTTRQLLEADTTRLLTGSCVLVDEWQQFPAVWDIIRRAVDAGAGPGQFLLTGSASAARRGTHSGAGRIVSVRMRPMTLPERGVAAPTVSLASLLTGSRSALDGQTDVDVGTYVAEIVRSGFPAIRETGPRARRAQLDGYVDRIIDHDFPDVLGREVRNPAALRRWITAYGAATATCASFEKIRAAATSGEGEKPAKTTVQPYRDNLENLYVLDPLPAWQPTRNRVAELAHAPKHHLVDPALAVAVLGLDERALLAGEDTAARVPRDGPFLGALFESLAVLGLRVFAQASEARCGHLRTHRGDHEIDVVVERRDGRVIAVETKLSANVGDEDVKHLRWLAERIGDELLDAVVITTGTHAYRRADGIAVVPAALLGP
jgi:uncharacterized protein